MHQLYLTQQTGYLQLMAAAGIDIGGTKIETQIFDSAWSLVRRHRSDTPDSYPELLSAIAAHIAWAQGEAGAPMPIGIGAAGREDARTGHWIAANLAADGQSLSADLGPQLTLMNDCTALAVSEAAFGAGKGQSRVAALVLGTGVGGGLAIDGAPLRGANGICGEFGHISAPAHILAQHKLPVVPCTCGRRGCIERYISGPGLTLLAQHLLGRKLTAPQIASERTGAAQPVWEIWRALVADLIHTITLTVDPDVIVLGGGLSRIEGLAPELTNAVQTTHISGFSSPAIVIAEGGDASGARGAAYSAWAAANGR